jgi:hypothetical protein
MSALPAEQIRSFIRETQARFHEIDHADWDGDRYHRSNTDKWTEASQEAVPEDFAEWREMVRVLAQGESYYGGNY